MNSDQPQDTQMRRIGDQFVRQSTMSFKSVTMNKPMTSQESQKPTIEPTAEHGSLNPLTQKTDGWKADDGKPRMDLLDPDFLEAVGAVLTFGADKYHAHNWRGGIHYSRLIAATYRHLGAINRGEDTDPESGLPHAAHLGCCIQFLYWMMENRKDMDDRWRQPDVRTA